MAVSITVVRGPDTGAKHESSSSRIVIGRKKGDVVVRDRETSGLHASIEYLPDGRFLLKDLGSTNGTWLDGRRVTVAELQPGQHVKIGANHLLFTVVDALAEATRSHAAEASAGAPPLPDPQWSHPPTAAWPSPPPALSTPGSPEPFAPAPPPEPFAPLPAPLPMEVLQIPELPLPVAPALAPTRPPMPELAGLPPLPPWDAPPAAVPAPPPPAPPPARPPAAALPPWPSAMPQAEMPALPPLPGAPKPAAPPPPPQRPAAASPPGASADGHPPLPPLPPWPGAPRPVHAPAERSTAISPARPLPREPLGGPAEPRGLPEGVESSVYGLYLLVERGRDRGRVFPINRQVTVLGRSGTDVLINDPDISRRHAALDVQGEGKYILRDLNSTNGTLLNGVPVTAEGVSPNDKIRLGATTIKLIMGDERLAAEHARLHAEPGTHS